MTEVTLVKEFDELYYWQRLGYYQMINKKNRKQQELFLRENELDLEGHEEFRLLFKVLILRSAVYDE